MRCVAASPESPIPQEEPCPTTHPEPRPGSNCPRPTPMPPPPSTATSSAGTPPSPEPPRRGGYRMFQSAGKNVAGLMGQMQEGQPTAWATYVSRRRRRRDRGEGQGRQAASVIVAPMDVTDLGRMAVFADPTGAVFGVWQPKAFAGADLVNEPVSLTWNEVHTRDTDADKAFYNSVFGWARRQTGVRGRPRHVHGLGTGRQAGRRHDGDGRGDVPARDAAPLERVLRRRRLRTTRSPRHASTAPPSPPSRWTCRSAASPP